MFTVKLKSNYSIDFAILKAKDGALAVDGQNQKGNCVCIRVWAEERLVNSSLSGNEMIDSLALIATD